MTELIIELAFISLRKKGLVMIEKNLHSGINSGRFFGFSLPGTGHMKA
ncbi:hypothetical protein [Morganella morganii]|nr:hypothetical protein [Morganella morganii]MCU6378091.1 hypothetical protein [Morganella morganii]